MKGDNTVTIIKQTPTGHGSDSLTPHGCSSLLCCLASFLLSFLKAVLKLFISSLWISYYLIQEKPNSHFVSHTICFKVKHLSSVTFKELNQLLFVSSIELLWELLGISMDTPWKLEIFSSFLGTNTFSSSWGIIFPEEGVFLRQDPLS